MGWLKSVTGAQGQIDAANANEAATSAAEKQTAQEDIQQSSDAALAASRQQSQIVQRQAASDAAAAALSAPLDTANVQLDAPTDDSAAGLANTKRKQFGTGTYSSGVNI